MSRRRGDRPDEDARTWASSIGSDTIDLLETRDRHSPRPLKASLIGNDKLAELRKLLEKPRD